MPLDFSVHALSWLVPLGVVLVVAWAFWGLAHVDSAEAPHPSTSADATRARRPAPSPSRPVPSRFAASTVMAGDVAEAAAARAAAFCAAQSIRRTGSFTIAGAAVRDQESRQSAVRTETAPTPVTAAPRTLNDLRSALSGRDFDSMQQFAVAAVLDGGFALGAVARVFRVPAWRLESWLEDAQRAAERPASAARPH
jgi:hypothetical protein